MSMNNVICTICHEQLLSNAGVVVINCGHLFHNVCLRQWNESSNTCPTCRFVITRKSIIPVYFDEDESNRPQEDPAHLKASIERLTAELALKEGKVQALTTRAHYLTEDVKVLRIKVTDDTKRISDLVRRVTDVENKNEFLTKENRTHLCNNVSLRQTNNRFRERDEYLRAQIKRLECIKDLIENHNSELSDEQRALQPEDLHVCLSSLKKDLKDLLTSEARLKNTIIEMNKTIQSLKNENVRATSSHNIVQGILEEVKKDYNNLLLATTNVDNSTTPGTSSLSSETPGTSYAAENVPSTSRQEPNARKRQADEEDNKNTAKKQAANKLKSFKYVTNKKKMDLKDLLTPEARIKNTLIEMNEIIQSLKNDIVQPPLIDNFFQGILEDIKKIYNLRATTNADNSTTPGTSSLSSETPGTSYAAENVPSTSRQEPNARKRQADEEDNINIAKKQAANSNKLKSFKIVTNKKKM